MDPGNLRHRCISPFDLVTTSQPGYRAAREKKPSREATRALHIADCISATPTRGTACNAQEASVHTAGAAPSCEVHRTVFQIITPSLSPTLSPGPGRYRYSGKFTPVGSKRISILRAPRTDPMQKHVQFTASHGAAPLPSGSLAYCCTALRSQQSCRVRDKEAT